MASDRLRLVRQSLDEVRRVDEPALHRVRLPGDRGLADAGRDRLAREGVPVVRVVDLLLLRLRVGRVRVRRHVHAGRLVEAALPPPAPEERVEERDRAAPLRVVPVPRRVAPGMHERRRPVSRHRARGLADDGRLDAGLGVRPFRGERGDLGGKGLEAEAVRGHVVLVVEPLADQHVHPGEEEREVGPRLDGQVVPRLARRDREAGVGHDDRGAVADRVGELLHLRVVHVLAEVRADEDEAAGVLDVGPLGGADRLPEGQLEAHVARAAALGEGRGGRVRRAEGLQRVLEERPADAVAEEGDGFGAVLRLDLQHLLGDVAQGLVPGDLGPLLLAAHARAHERRAHPVGVEVRADAPGSPRAEAAARERVVRVALDLPQDAVPDGGDRVALPEAEVAEGRDGADPLLDRALRGAQAGKRSEGPGGGSDPGPGPGDLQEASA